MYLFQFDIIKVNNEKATESMWEVEYTNQKVGWAPRLSGDRISRFSRSIPHFHVNLHGSLPMTLRTKPLTFQQHVYHHGHNNYSDYLRSKDGEESWMEVMTYTIEEIREVWIFFTTRSLTIKSFRFSYCYCKKLTVEMSRGVGHSKFGWTKI